MKCVIFALASSVRVCRLVHQSALKTVVSPSLRRLSPTLQQSSNTTRMMATCNLEKSNDDCCLEVNKENANVVESTEMKKSDTLSAETLLDTVTTIENKGSVTEAEGGDVQHELEVRKTFINFLLKY